MKVEALCSGSISSRLTTITAIAYYLSMYNLTNPLSMFIKFTNRKLSGIIICSLFLAILVGCQPNDPQLQMTLEGHQYVVTTVDVSPDGQWIASGGGRYESNKGGIPFGELFLWERKTGKLVRKFDVDDKMITQLRFDSQGKTIITAANFISHDYEYLGAKLTRWDVENGGAIDSITINKGRIDAFDISSDNKIYLSACINDTSKLLVYSIDDWNTCIDLKYKDYPISSIDISENKNYLSIVGTKLNLIDFLNDTILTITENSSMSQACFSKNSNYLLTCWSGVDVFKSKSAPNTQLHFLKGGAFLYELKTQDTISVFTPGFDDAGLCVCMINNSGDYLLGGKSNIYLVNKRGRKIHTFKGHTNPIQEIVICPDNKSFISASNDGTVRVWALL